ncbi:hypothetical protein BDR04DRAFT_1089717 [Suillus decipiens]|nr:hypothetical protein BDR04DRAFT_1089717 [Suillus decipiens]
MPHPITISNTNHGVQPEPAALSYPQMLDAPSSSIKHAHYDSTQEQYLTQSVSGFKSLSNYGSWHSPTTPHNYGTQNDPVLGGTCAPAIGNNYQPLHTFQMHYPDVYPETPAYDFRPYNKPLHQAQNFATPHPGPLNGPLPLMTPSPLAVEAFQMRLLSQARARHGRNIYYLKSHTHCQPATFGPAS